MVECTYVLFTFSSLLGYDVTTLPLPVYLPVPLDQTLISSVTEFTIFGKMSHKNEL